MDENFFSKYKSTKTALEIGRFRKVGHSASDWFSAKMSSDKTDIFATGLSGANNAAGALATGAAVAAWAGSSAAFVAAMTGPQAAAVIGLVAIGLLVKETYSNREAAHKEIAPYVWTFVDDKPPKKFDNIEELRRICAAASTLLEDGKSQFNTMHSKYSEKEMIFRQFITVYQEKLWAIGILEKKLKLEVKSVPANKPSDNNLLRYNIALAEEMYEKAIAVDGVISEYVRRCCHLGHYMQASAILNLGIRETLQPKSVIGQQTENYFPDFFKNTPFEQTRLLFKRMGGHLQDFPFPLSELEKRLADNGI